MKFKRIKVIRINVDSDVRVINLRALAGPTKIRETLIKLCVSHHFRLKMGPLPSPAGRLSGSPLGAFWQAGRAENEKTEIKELRT